MTAEHRLVIEVSDIAGFEFECPRCETRMFVPIAKYDGLSLACANCRERWFGTIGGPDHVFMHELLDRIKDYEKHPQHAVKLRLQLNADLVKDVNCGREEKKGSIKSGSN
jgi:hypothetical protein